jgi:2-haloacid dehalogenase
MAADALGVPVRQLWLVAAHGWDVAGALAAVCRAAFVPDLTGKDLDLVADQLLALH